MDWKGARVSAILLLVAVILFVLAAFGVDVGDYGPLQVVAAGLAFFAASFLVGPVVAYLDTRGPRA